VFHSSLLGKVLPLQLQVLYIQPYLIQWQGSGTHLQKGVEQKMGTSPRHYRTQLDVKVLAHGGTKEYNCNKESCKTLFF